MFLTLIDGRLVPDTSGRDYRKLDNLQAFVGGYIERVLLPSPGDRQVSGWINEEGKLIPLKPNFILPGVDVIYGPMLITAVDAAGEVAPLTEMEASNLYLVPTPMGIPALFGAWGPYDPTPILTDV